MAGLNLDKVNGALTFIAKGEHDLKNIAIALEEAIAANRRSDELLRDTGLLDKHDFYRNEMAYSRTERIFSKIRHGSLSALKASSPVP